MDMGEIHPAPSSSYTTATGSRTAMEEQTTTLVQPEMPAVTSDGQLQPPWIAARSANWNYTRDRSTKLGVTLIVVGTLTIIFNLVKVADMRSVDGPSGYIFCSGVLYLIAGGLGTGAASTATGWMIISFVFVSNCAATVCATQLYFCGTRLYLATKLLLEFDASSIYSQYYVSEISVVIAMESLLLILGIVGGVSAIWGFVIWCKVMHFGFADCSDSSTAMLQQQTTAAIQSSVPVVTTNGQLEPPGMVVRPSNWIDNYKTCQSTGLGVTLINVGALSIIFNIVEVIDLRSGKALRYAFWCGCLCIIAGVLGIEAARRRTLGMIISFMVMGIIAANACAGMISYAVILVAVVSYSDEIMIYYDNKQLSVFVLMETLLIIVGVVGGIAAIWGSVICCRAVCCRAPTRAPGASVTVDTHLTQQVTYSRVPVNSQCSIQQIQPNPRPHVAVCDQ